MNVSEQVANYQVADQAIQLVKNARIILLVGIAGAGKDTLKQRLLRSPDFRDIVSHTTRLPRSNNGVAEIDGKDYHFISLEQAATMIDQRKFVEVKYVHGDTIYGTSVAEIKAGYDEGKILVTDIDVQGVSEYKQISNGVTAIFLLPPSFEVWQERLRKRYESKEAFQNEWPKRRASALKELEHALSVPYYHFIINDDLERTVRVASEIAKRPDSFHRKDDEARLAARDLLEQLRLQD